MAGMLVRPAMAYTAARLPDVDYDHLETLTAGHRECATRRL